MPNYYTTEVANSGLTRGNHLIANDDGSITIRVVARMIEDIPKEEITDHKIFQYSDSMFAVAELTFENEATIRKRLEEAESEANEIRQSTGYVLHQSTIEERGRLKEERQKLIHQIRDESSQ